MSTSTPAAFQPVDQGATLWSISVYVRRNADTGEPELYVREVTQTVAKVTPQRLRWVEDRDARYPETVHRAKPNDLGLVAMVHSYGAGGRFYASREQAIAAMLDANDGARKHVEAKLAAVIARWEVAHTYV